MLILVIVIILFIFTVAVSAVFFQTKKDLFEKALALAAMGNYLDARGMVRGHLEGSPGDAKGHFVMSKIYSMEGDFLHEAQHLDKIKAKGEYTTEFPAVFVSNRIADIYYQNEMYEESLFHYLDTVKIDPDNAEALIRIGFMALGRKEFQIASFFLEKLREKNLKYAYYYTGLGVVDAMLGNNNETEYFQKAYKMDPSPVNGFLYAIALFRHRHFEQAVEIANKIVDDIEDEFVRYTIYLFIMIQHMQMDDLPNALKHARLCMESARMNGWHVEFLDSEYYYSLLLVAAGRLEDAAEFLIDVESERIDDEDVIGLANYKFDIEQGGNGVDSGYDLKKAMNVLGNRHFPTERYYELSGLKIEKPINISGMVSPEGVKLVNKLDMLGIDKLAHFTGMKGTAFKNACIRLITLLKYRVSREIPYREDDGLNFIGMKKGNMDENALFRIRKWKGSKVSDVFLRDMLGAINDMNVDKGFLVADTELTEGAKNVLKNNAERLEIVSGDQLQKLLEETLV